MSSLSRTAARPARRDSPPRGTPPRRALGRTGLAISPLVVSGAFEMSPGALLQAWEAGANGYFWEPRYAAMTRFLRGERRRRDEMVIIAGSYHAGEAAIRADVTSALRRLRTTHLDVFLLFWVRSPARLETGAFEALSRLKKEGKIRAFGFSTHHREIALAAVEARPWDVVMTRHNAAHVGAETTLFPALHARGTGLLTFSAVAYGRMLQEHEGAARPSAADCYRYSLSQTGVSAVLSAPRRYRELMANLEVLKNPTLDAAGLARLRAHGAHVYRESKAFNALVRAAPGGTRAAALALFDDPGDPSIG